MSTVYDVSAWEIIQEVADILKKDYPEVTPPPGSQFWKTGQHKERAPEQPDWWYIRCASILRKVYLTGPVGVSRLRTVYGGRKRMSVKLNRSVKGSGSIIRKVFQQLEEAGLVEIIERKGRRISGKGRSVMDRAAHQVNLKLEGGKS
ncbi:MAG: 30S ribosomal protein S19e [Candidatus Jordarchaeum sp.]|uniref:30S ribosomal protein S19e n=1 Tax=Candidatus Jordarchaeum sp. TaxID=2823881 RepID=UPI00404B241B